MPTLKQFREATGIEARRWKEVYSRVNEVMTPPADPPEEVPEQRVTVRSIADETGFPI